MRIGTILFAGLLWTGVFGCAHVEAQESAGAYFKTVLQGKDKLYTSTRPLKLREVEEHRAAVWQAWCRANADYAEEKLPAPRPLTDTDTLKWPLPPELEPNAVMPFYYGTKGDRPAQGWPLFLYLHGSGPKAQEFSTGYIICQRFDDAPSLYFIPQIPQENEYYRWYQQSKQFAWERLLRLAFTGGDVDVNRVYIFGISEGGYGSQRLASFYADYLAAAGPMAGGEVTENAPAENCGHIGFSLLTGEKDVMFGRDRLTRRAGELLDSLQTRYPGEYVHDVQLMPGYGHGINYSPTTPWLKTFVRTPRPKHFVWEDYPMDGRYRKGFYNVQVHERDTAGGNQRTRYEMNIKNNTVEFSVDRVRYEATECEPNWGIPMRQRTHCEPATGGRFTVYLDGSLLDLHRKVTLIVNGRRVFSGRLSADEANLVNSSACFFDPERVFPAAIHVDLTAGKATGTWGEN